MNVVVQNFSSLSPLFRQVYLKSGKFAIDLEACGLLNWNRCEDFSPALTVERFQVLSCHQCRCLQTVKFLFSGKCFFCKHFAFKCWDTANMAAMEAFHKSSDNTCQSKKIKRKEHDKISKIATDHLYLY